MLIKVFNAHSVARTCSIVPKQDGNDSVEVNPRYIVASLSLNAGVCTVYPVRPASLKKANSEILLFKE